MIIECDKCGTKFDLDASLIKEGGIKARCSRCKHVFRVFPPEPEFNEKAETLPVKKEEMEATVALKSSPLADKRSRIPILRMPLASPLSRLKNLRRFHRRICSLFCPRPQRRKFPPMPGPLKNRNRMFRIKVKRRPNRSALP